MTTSRKIIFLALIAAIGLALLSLRRCGNKPAPAAPMVEVPLAPAPAPVLPPPVPVKPAPPKAVHAPAPAVVIHKELIPKDIEIVRIYYPSSITGPDSTIPFDINGSGFTKEFEKMIKAESGNDNVAVTELGLITLNQIHGTLKVNARAATGVSFPRVLIQGKVVFQAEDPYAVIRPGEVLNVIFTEMGDNGRSGRFRCFTNLTPEMFAQFSVTSDTPTIEVSGLSPQLPFVVDGGINIGGTGGGAYGLIVKIAEKTVWERKGIVRVVRPNVGQTGLVQQVKAADGFHRPGDAAKFFLIGSGFQPNDTAVLSAQVKEFGTAPSSFTYLSAGRMALTLAVPLTAGPSTYTLGIYQGNTLLTDVKAAFTVVRPNWTRGLAMDPPLTPGGQSTVSLLGRDLDDDFVAGLAVAVDEPGLVVGKFQRVSKDEAAASISAAADVAPGDYWLKISSQGKSIKPQFGSIIDVSPK